MNTVLIIFGKLVSFVICLLNVGYGSTWPGHIALTLNPHFLRQFSQTFKGSIILIAGTNGKTTTAKMLHTILENQGRRVIHNEAGANLLNGIASAVIQNASLFGKGSETHAIFEVDENTLAYAIGELSPIIIVLLNLFRDQLDRYGEVDAIARKWKKALEAYPKATVILNADDPHIVYIGSNLKNALYFGIDDKKQFRKTPQHAMDATYCPACGTRISFSGIYFSHLGVWRCSSCCFSRPKIQKILVNPILPGFYNLYNLRAALLIAETLQVPLEKATASLVSFTPAFGRQEEFLVQGKKVKLFLSKNPAGFNESIRTVRELGAKHVLLVLNDRIPDGRDVSWIWDVDTEELSEAKIAAITVSGDRVYDMALRIKYSSSSEFQIEEDLKRAITLALKKTPRTEVLYILPTYSAMLEVRKILTGRRIL